MRDILRCAAADFLWWQRVVLVVAVVALFRFRIGER